MQIKSKTVHPITKARYLALDNTIYFGTFKDRWRRWFLTFSSRLDHQPISEKKQWIDTLDPSSNQTTDIIRSFRSVN